MKKTEKLVEKSYSRKIGLNNQKTARGLSFEVD